MIDQSHLDKSFKHLEAGKYYFVIKEFTDFDNIVHPVGEKWEFIGTSFFPYDSGRSIFVNINSQRVQIRMQDYPPEYDPNAQGYILNAFDEYVRPAT